MPSDNFAKYLQNRLDDVNTRFSDNKSKAILKKMQIAKAVSQIDLLTNKIKGVRVRLQRAEEQNNVIFINPLEMELTTLENVRCVYHRFIAHRRRDLLKLEFQKNDLGNEMMMLVTRMNGGYSDNDDSDSDDSESDDSESDDSESDDSESNDSESNDSKSDDSESDENNGISKKERTMWI